MKIIVEDTDRKRTKNADSDPTCGMWPNDLLPVDVQILALGGAVVRVPLCRPHFDAWNGTADGVHTWGGKALLQVDGRPQFAEVAILRLFEEGGWQCRWLETYPYRKNPRFWQEWDARGPNHQVQVPIETPWVYERLQAIAHANGGYFSGCWDVVAWKNDRLVFAEAKLQKKDKMRPTQLRWLEAALKCGCAVEDFLVVEWALVC